MQVKLNLELLDDIGDDMEFCIKLAEEESVVVLPGKNQNSLACIKIEHRISISLTCNNTPNRRMSKHIISALDQTVRSTTRTQI